MLSRDLKTRIFVFERVIQYKVSLRKKETDRQIYKKTDRNRQKEIEKERENDYAIVSKAA